MQPHPLDPLPLQEGEGEMGLEGLCPSNSLQERGDRRLDSGGSYALLVFRDRTGGLRTSNRHSRGVQRSGAPMARVWGCAPDTTLPSSFPPSLVRKGDRGMVASILRRGAGPLCPAKRVFLVDGAKSSRSPAASGLCARCLEGRSPHGRSFALAAGERKTLKEMCSPSPSKGEGVGGEVVSIPVIRRGETGYPKMS